LAQTIPFGTYAVGSSFNYDFGAGLRQELQTLSSQDMNLFTLTFSFSASGTLPPGLTLTSDGLLSGTFTTAGTYSAPINLTFNVVYASSLGIPPFSETFPLASYSFTVTGGNGPGSVTVSPGGLSFNLVAGASSSQQSLTVSNGTASPVTFSASSSGASWLAAPSGGSVPAFGQTSVIVTVNPAGLAAGTYTGSITITPSGKPAITIPVILTVTGSSQLLRISQSGLFFGASQGGPAPPSQSFLVTNAGTGNLAFSAVASTQSGGSWLSVTTAGTLVTATVNPSGLPAATYYGVVQVTSPGASNSPQVVTVVLSISSATTPPDPDVRPTGLIFLGKVGGTDPAAKTVQLTNLASTAVTYTASVSYSNGSGWLSVNPSGGTVAPGTPATPQIVTKLAGLTPGIYNGQVVFIFLPSGAIRRVAVVLIVLPAGSVASPDVGSVSVEPTARDASGCTPSKLIPVFTLLGQSFTTSAAWPISLEVTVVDDCGNAMTTGSVVTSFSSGDEPLSLTSLNDGRWSGTWTPHNSSTASVSITAMAQTVAPVLSGSAMIGGTSKTNPGVPLVKTGGIVNAASNAPSTPVAPGSYISIYGTALASGLTVAAAPFPTTLGGTQVLLAGQAIPLYFTSDGQINALVPYGMTTNAASQLIVARNGAYSSPEQVTFADGGPAVFLSQGAGIAVDVKSDGTQFLVDSTHPTTAGDALVIYCAGLGAVTPPVAAGAVAPSSPLASTASPVTVTIEGVPASVFFAGLAPGFAGLYQVNVIVPSGLTPSTSAPLVLTVAGQSSPPATISVQ
jgi:uncharacterized protein (TIGR03437 family)